MKYAPLSKETSSAGSFLRAHFERLIFEALVEWPGERTRGQAFPLLPRQSLLDSCLSLDWQLPGCVFQKNKRMKVRVGRWAWEWEGHRAITRPLAFRPSQHQPGSARHMPSSCLALVWQLTGCVFQKDMRMKVGVGR